MLGSKVLQLKLHKNNQDYANYCLILLTLETINNNNF